MVNELKNLDLNHNLIQAMCEISASRGQILTKQQLEELNNETLRVQNGIALLKFCWSREKIKQKFDERELRVRFQTIYNSALIF